MASDMGLVAYYRVRSKDPRSHDHLNEQRKIVETFNANQFEIVAEFIEDEDVGVGLQFEQALEMALKETAVLAIATRKPIGDGKRFEPNLPTADEAFLVVFDPDDFAV